MTLAGELIDSTGAMSGGGPPGLASASSPPPSLVLSKWPSARL